MKALNYSEHYEKCKKNFSLKMNRSSPTEIRGILINIRKDKLSRKA